MWWLSLTRRGKRDEDVVVDKAGNPVQERAAEFKAIESFEEI
jgi:hypothetical protein